MSRLFNVAVVGATGLVGETMLAVLQERQFPVDQVFPLASQRSAGKTIEFGKQTLTVGAVEQFDFAQADIALFSAGDDVSERYVPQAVQAGCAVIDNTSCYRYQEAIPLVVPEVNPEALKEFPHNRIIANPNCSTIQMVVALKPIYDAVGITRINVATYQSVSGSGTVALDELSQQATQVLAGTDVEPEVYSQQIAFNVLPHIDDFQANGYTREEMKMVWETQKIFADKQIKVNPTAVRVPVFYGHSEAVHLETKRKLSAKEARTLLQNAPSVTVVDEPDALCYPTPVTHAAGNNKVYVGRIREDISYPNGLNLWVTADNIRKGAALNSVQIAELLIQKQYI